MSYESVIGLEIHAQLRTDTKIFCGCRTEFGAPPNAQVCPVCVGLPGALPVLNTLAVDHAIKAALALGCAVQAESVFARKNYFYPDLPKGYQISQFDRPLALGGGIDITVDGAATRVNLTRIHMEEDAGKSLHDGFIDSETRTYLDYNRSGVPLIEIVSEPDMRSADQAAEYFERLRDILRWIGVNDGNMEEGSLRCDANVSVRPAGQQALGTKVEVKNLNSFRYLHKALEFEIERQIEVVESGGRIVQETRLWDSVGHRTVSMRSKEEAHDYRYFPEPDLPPVIVDETRIARVRASMPELPDARRARFASQYGLPEYDAGVLTQSSDVADFFEVVASASGNAKATSNWTMGEVLRTLKDRDVLLADLALTPAGLSSLIRLIDAGTISSTIAKDVFAKMLESGELADAIVAREGLAQNSDESALLAIVADVIARNPDAATQYRAGKMQTFGFLVGQVMKDSGGKANPKLVNQLLRRALDAP